MVHAVTPDFRKYLSYDICAESAPESYVNEVFDHVEKLFLLLFTFFCSVCMRQSVIIVESHR